jgi:transcriptional regulator with XRE-family HTH domain
LRKRLETTTVSHVALEADLPAALRHFRENKAVTQEAVAHAAGLTVSTYARIERGEADPRWTTVMRIADALGVTASELVSAAEEGPPNEP